MFCTCTTCYHLLPAFCLHAATPACLSSFYLPCCCVFLLYFHCHQFRFVLLCLVLASLFPTAAGVDFGFVLFCTSAHYVWHVPYHCHSTATACSFYLATTIHLLPYTTCLPNFHTYHSFFVCFFVFAFSGFGLGFGFCFALSDARGALDNHTCNNQYKEQTMLVSRFPTKHN